MSTPRRRTFLIESYVPALDEETALSLSSKLRVAVDELQKGGRKVDWLRSFALLGEETYVWMLIAGDVDDVALVNRRAGVSYDHVVEVVGGEPLASP
jgi:hypothetical protein